MGTVSRVEPIPRFQRLVGGRRTAGEGREVRERLAAQLPANTRAHSISQRPSDATSHCPASAWKHTHTHTPLLHATFCTPSTSLLCCAPLLALWGGAGGAAFNAASCWFYLLPPRLTHTHTPGRRQCHSTGRLVQNGMQTGGRWWL